MLEGGGSPLAVARVSSSSCIQHEEITHSTGSYQTKGIFSQPYTVLMGQ
jgi:hypothetical protein